MSYKKYYIYKEQYSNDGGQTWIDTGNETASGDPIGTYSTLAECEGLGMKFNATYIDTSTYSSACDDNPILVKGDFSGHTTPLSGISTIEISDCVTQIGSGVGDGVFKDSRLNSVTFPNTLVTIADGSFSQCDYLTGATIPSGVTTIGGSAFYYNIRLKNINIPSGVTTINSSTFENCYALSSCTIPNDSSLTSIKNKAFKTCRSLTNINIPSTVTVFGDECFMSCSGLTSINIPFGTLTIPQAMMNGCSSLTSVTIPSTVYEIKSNAFRNCTGLQYIECLAQYAPSLGNTPFDWRCPIYVPDDSVEDYKAASGWGSYPDLIKPISEKP